MLTDKELTEIQVGLTRASNTIDKLQSENNQLQAALDRAISPNIFEEVANTATYLQKENDTLRAQLAAAVEDLKKLATKPIKPCHSCGKSCVFPSDKYPGLGPIWCSDWQWRGGKAIAEQAKEADQNG